jgi:hypothetical protein
MKHKTIHIKQATLQDRIHKLSDLNTLLLNTDISTACIDNIALDRIYEANTLLNYIILESNLIIDELNNYLSTKQ